MAKKQISMSPLVKDLEAQLKSARETIVQCYADMQEVATVHRENERRRDVIHRQLDDVNKYAELVKNTLRSLRQIELRLSENEVNNV